MKVLLPIGIVLLILGAIFTVEAAYVYGWLALPTQKTVDITVKTVDQQDTPLNAEIFVDGQMIGTKSVTFKAEVGKVYEVTFGSLNDYVTPDRVVFALGPDGKLADGTTIIVGIYAPIESPTPNQVKLTVSVRVYSNTLKTSYTLPDAEVTISYMNLKGKTDSNGFVFFWVPVNYGEIRIDVYHSVWGTTASLVTIGTTDTMTTIYFITSGLMIAPFGILGLAEAGISVDIVLMIGIVMLFVGIACTYTGAKAFVKR